ncbi:MAG: signal peptidase I [Deltaproteobacteria bacterium]|nr:signal peptidase I [Deltaproteobacteria bacterium]MBI3293827.1 signal peptidase I [Deltaproteobacteria bacterium]
MEEKTDRSAARSTDEAAEGKRDLRNAFALCVLAVIVFRSFIVEPFKIPSTSMVPTLQKGDHIFVSKFSYGLSLPFSKTLLAKWASPRRGDVIVFLFPRDESVHYIKRVVGVPGDKIQIEGRKVVINGQEVKRDLISNVASLEHVYGSENLSGEIYAEKLGDVDHFVRFAGKRSDSRGTTEWEVPPDQFFVMGDNRDDSYDSREGYFVPRENIKGRAQVIWLSLDMERAWGKMDKVRWARSFVKIR